MNISEANKKQEELQKKIDAIMDKDTIITTELNATTDPQKRTELLKAKNDNLKPVRRLTKQFFQTL
jgi:hypothetical protein